MSLNTRYEKVSTPSYDGLSGLGARESLSGVIGNPTPKTGVTLIETMGNDLSVVNAARVSFGKYMSPSELTDQDKIRNKSLIKYLLKNQHTSPFRHCFMTFHVKAPIFVVRQWAKHQVGCSWNEISMRYVKSKLGFWTPDEWRSAPIGSVKQGSGAPMDLDVQAEITAAYDKALKVCSDAYEGMLKAGVCREQARAVLPQAMFTEFWWTASLQAVLHFLDLRLAKDAQGEIREYAEEIERLVKMQFPDTLEAWRLVKEDE